MLKEIQIVESNIKEVNINDVYQMKKSYRTGETSFFLIRLGAKPIKGRTTYNDEDILHSFKFSITKDGEEIRNYSHIYHASKQKKVTNGTYVLTSYVLLKNKNNKRDEDCEVYKMVYTCDIDDFDKISPKDFRTSLADYIRRKCIINYAKLEVVFGFRYI